MKSKIKMMTLTVGMIVLSLAGVILFSSFRAASESGKAKLVMDIRTYLDKNVKPIMKPQRAKLDQVLTAEEKVQVAALNKRLQKLVRDRKQAGIGFLGTKDFSFDEVPELSSKQRSQQKAGRDEMRRIMAQAWAIADRHEADIDRLLGEKANFFDTWERGITAVITDYLDDKFYFIGKKQIVKRFKNQEIVRYYTPVAFLLWDPQQQLFPDELIK
jgi:hypothetical protein